MFCSECGSQIPDGGTICPNCGTAQPVQAAAPQPEAQPTYQAAPQPEPQPTYQAAPQPQPTYQQAPVDQQQYAYQQQAAPQPQPQPAYPQQPASQGFSFDQLVPPPLNFTFEAPASAGDVFVGTNKEGVAYAESTGLSMKWFSALATWLLYLSAFGFIISGIQYLTGGVYGGGYYADLTYAVFPALKAIDIIFGIVYIAFAAVVLYVRMRLAQFKKDAPVLFLYMLLLNIGISLAYSILSLICTGFGTFGSVLVTLILTIVISGAIYYANKIYFDKRQHLFTM